MPNLHTAIGALSIDTKLRKHVSATIRTDVSSSNCSVRVKNAIARSLRRGWHDSFSGESAAIWRVLCGIADTPAQFVTDERVILMSNPTEKRKIEALIHDKWVPMWKLIYGPSHNSRNWQGYYGNSYRTRYYGTDMFYVDMPKDPQLIECIHADLREHAVAYSQPNETLAKMASTWVTGTSISGTVQYQFAARKAA